MSRIVCVIILIVTAVVGPSYACTCAPAPVEQKFCSAQFAALFLIRDHGTVIGGPFGVKRYKVDLIYLYRTVLGPVAEPGYLYTPALGSLCGVPLYKGNFYVVAGSYVPFGYSRYSRMTTNLCQLQMEFSYNPVYTYDRPDCEDFTYASVNAAVL